LNVHVVQRVWCVYMSTMLKPISTSSTNSNENQQQQQLPLTNTTSDQSKMNQELDLDNYMFQYNIAQLVSMENNTNHPNAHQDDYANLLCELNNNNPLLLNNSVIANTSSSLQFSDCPSTPINNGNHSLLSPQSHHTNNNSPSQHLFNTNHLQQTQQLQLTPLPNLQANSTRRSFNNPSSPHSQPSTPTSDRGQHHSIRFQSPMVSGRTKACPVLIKNKFGGLGQGNGQLSSPHGFCLGADEEIVIADTFNHRICVFNKNGEFQQQFGNQGKDDGQLWYPRKVALIKRPIINESKFVVCDRGSERSRMQLFSRNGQFLSRIAIKFIDIVAGLAVTEDGNIVAVDSVSATLFVISESGQLLKCFECGIHMEEPSDIAINGDLFYICDFKGHNIVVFNSRGDFVGKIGDKKLTNYPNGIDIAENGDILCGDSHGNKFHIVVFDRTGKFLKEFECLYAKVSRCCGLKITKEGYIVTLAKNNHHVLILDSLESASNNNGQHNQHSSSAMNSPISKHYLQQQQMLPMLNSPTHLSSNSSTPTTMNNTKEDLDLSNCMTQYNLALLASFCDPNNSALPNHLQQSQTPPILSPQQQKIAAFNQMNNNDNLTPNHNLMSVVKSNQQHNKQHQSQHNSSILNTSIIEQLQDLSFNDSNNSFMLGNLSGKSTMNNNDLITTGGNRADLNNSMLASPTPPDSTVSTPNSKSGKISMAIKYRFGHLGSGQDQFSSPHGFCLSADEEIVIADTYNHRICVFSKEGEFLSQFGQQGKDDGELFHPRKVAVTKISACTLSNLQQHQQSKFVVCDRGNEKSRMQLFNRNGQFVRKISIRYIDIVAGLAITPTNNIVAVDSVMPTVFMISSETGELSKWFDCSKQMREPSDIAINGDLYYICDFKGHCVVVFNENGDFLHKIGNETITKFPNGIDISDMGDILVGDSHGNRFHVVVFDKNGKALCEYECPYVKVSRCCGLKLSSEGYVVTLAKNNHHVLVLNTLFVI